MPLPLTTLLLLPIMPVILLFLNLFDSILGGSVQYEWEEIFSMFREWPAVMSQLFQGLNDINFFQGMWDVLLQWIQAVLG